MRFTFNKKILPLTLDNIDDRIKCQIKKRSPNLKQKINSSFSTISKNSIKSLELVIDEFVEINNL